MKEFGSMKKILILMCLLVFPLTVYAKKEEVKLIKCIDGDTVTVKLNNDNIKVRFLAIDTSEIDKNEPFANEAKNFTCDILNKSKKIYLEYDEKSDKTDKYGRVLAWVWADNILVQKEIIKNGYGKVSYLYDKYKYINDLKALENEAKDNKINIWNDNTIEEKEKNKTSDKIDLIIDTINKYYSIIVVILGMILALLTYYIKIKK